MTIKEIKKPNTSNLNLRYKQLQEFETEVNWKKLVNSTVNYYVESGISRLQVPIESMIRIYFLQVRYNLGAAEAALALSRIDILREFALIDIKIDVLPEEESIDSFRSLIELKDLAKQFATEFNIKPLKQTSS